MCIHVHEHFLLFRFVLLSFNIFLIFHFLLCLLLAFVFRFFLLCHLSILHIIYKSFLLAISISTFRVLKPLWSLWKIRLLSPLGRGWLGMSSLDWFEIALLCVPTLFCLCVAACLAWDEQSWLIWNISLLCVPTLFCLCVAACLAWDEQSWLIWNIPAVCAHTILSVCGSVSGMGWAVLTDLKYPCCVCPHYSVCVWQHVWLGMSSLAHTMSNPLSRSVAEMLLLCCWDVHQPRHKETAGPHS